MDFSFLKNTTLNKVEEKTQATNKNTSTKKLERNPTNGASLRLFKDGSIYPSQECVDNYDLEYNERTLTTTSPTDGNGFDIIDSRQWNMYPEDATPVVFIAAVPKKSGLVDLFASAKKEGISVMTQGSKTFGPTLIQMLEEVYNVELFKDSKYVDLVIVEDTAMTAEDGIYNVPKTVAKGENKGMMTTKRRENITVNPLALFTQPTQEEDNVEEELIKQEAELEVA